MVGLVLYISSINDEMLNRTRDAETYFSYKYGWSFAFAAISFLLTEVKPSRGLDGGGAAGRGRTCIHSFTSYKSVCTPHHNSQGQMQHPETAQSIKQSNKAATASQGKSPVPP